MITLIFVLLIGCSTTISAQDLRGVVKDVNSRLPIANAKIITSKATILTDNRGAFRLENVKPGDRLAIRIMVMKQLN